MPDRSAVSPRKVPQQRRSQALVSAVIEAAVRILKHGREEALTTRRVAEIAGASVGSLYQYFPNRDAIVRALIDSHVREMLARLDEKMRDALCATCPEEMVRRFAMGLVAAHTVDLDRWQVIALQVLRFGDLDANDEAWQMFNERAQELVQRVAPELPAEEASRAAARLVLLVRTLLMDALTQRPDELRDLRLTADITDLILGYIGRLRERHAKEHAAPETPG
ncbi:TetR/AcrR family transcriptional regulator [Polyangium jinanense]|uniref:TetR/AcrR family transcriptional regulator n=1 Tax=Polyangium jinanense TaxID=2829994 RepID=A0A9X4AWN7_9BACT|nr:TetR/AcrR family transcriptional regulator [Polyangium jinanense]MDC3957060.1 TetR/AcrR family transcriptional regulator [Polyangium jinanense]MDC3987066.1 TetR/AcrR family transcriptional regulator [Polyangium jinanense]